ncbi:MAG: cbb3-type cytochrome oxidase assembly protein [Candidatus Melainabacteria bacterium]|nr:cbb3-type cytochrome oxidase assembly protein [Candidatus Melainabacteria bacterium]
MCPNCVLNQAPLDTGIYVAFTVCAIFFVGAVLAMLWALRNGDFEDFEGSKFEMLDDAPDGGAAQKARAAVDRIRAAKGES